MKSVGPYILASVAVLGSLIGSSFLTSRPELLDGFLRTHSSNSSRRALASERPPAIHAVSKPCSAEEREKIKLTKFMKTKLTILGQSSLPLTTWKDRMIREDQIFEPKPLYRAVTIGCNKAIDAIGTARDLSRNPVFDKNAWYNAMTRATGLKEFSLFKPKEEVLSQSPIKTGEKDFEVDMHCVEPLPVNFNAIQKATKSLDLDKHGFHSHQYALSSSTGTARFPSAAGPGEESFGLDSCNADPSKCEDVEMLTVDDFATRHLQGPEKIDVLSIDAEGYDFQVLKGATETLKKTRYVEFEYHRKWNADKLQDAADYLEELGFQCYYLGKERLYRITNQCWVDEFEAHVWSNVGCVSNDEKHWLSAMEGLFWGTIYELP